MRHLVMAVFGGVIVIMVPGVAVPEPTSLVLLGTGLIVAARGMRQSRKASELQSNGVPA
jgi:hypothetical protein